MAKEDKDLEERIRQAAKAGRITYASTDEIQDYEVIATEFFKRIFNLKFSDCFVSDEATLSDFATCVLTEGSTEGLTLQEILGLGKTVMKDKIEKQYGIETSPNDTLVSVFEQLRRIKTKRSH